MLQYDGNLKERSRQLRADMTVAERVLWARMRLRQINGFQFCRQRPIGNYIVDFFCHKAKLVVEVDGSQHRSGEIAENDRARDEYLRVHGLKVPRFTNADVLRNIDGVVGRIAEILERKA